MEELELFRSKEVECPTPSIFLSPLSVYLPWMPPKVNNW